MSERYNCKNCAICNPKVYAFWFGEGIPKKRRSREDIILEKRRKQKAVADRKEFFARLKLEKEAVKQKMDNTAI